MSKREIIMESKKNSRLRWMLGVLCMLYAGSMFADEAVIDDITYDLDTYSKTAKVLSVSQDAESITIPAIVTYEEENYEVTGLEYDVTFAGNINLKSVTIEMSLDEVPNSFFEGCTKLSSVKLPESVTFIGYLSFSGCESLTSLSFLPKSVTKVASMAFYKCTGLEEIVIRKGVTYTSDAFDGCSGVASVIIEAVESNVFIGYGGFTSLKSVRIEDCDAPLSVSLPDDAPIEELYIGRNIGLGFNKTNLRTVTFGEKVTYVPEGMFDGASALSSVNWGNNIKWIGARAFYGANLVDLSLPANVDSLAAGAFDENHALATVKLPSSLRYLGSNFSGSAISEIKLPESLVYFDGLQDCDLITHVVIPDGVKEIGALGFSSCKILEEVVIGKNVESIGLSLFENSKKVQNIYYNGTLSDWCRIDIGNQSDDSFGKNFYVKTDAGSYSAITDLVIPDDIEVVKTNTFSGLQSFNSVTIPNHVRKIDEYAFGGCNMKTLYVNADSVAYRAFYGCNNMQAVTLGTNVKVLEGNAFEAMYKAVTYEGDMKSWMNLPKGGLNCGELTIDGELIVDFSPEQYSINEIPAATFKGCTSLKTVNLPYGVKEIGGMAFFECNNLTEVTAKGVTKIGDYAFAYCDNLSKANMFLGNATRGSNSEAIYIGTSAFSGCTKLGEIVLPDNIAYIGSYAFDNTLWFNNLSDGPVYLGSILYTYKGEMPENTTITVKDGTTMICEWAFSSQYNLIGISLPQTIANIGDYAFSYSGLKSFEIPASVDTIPRGLLSNCYNVRSLTISSGVNFVSRSAFDGCDSLENIHIADAETPLVWEGYYLAYTDMYGGMYFPMAPEGWGFPNSYPKNLYLGRDMESPTLIYDMGYGEQSYRMYLSDLFHTDSLRTLTIGKDVTTLNLPTMPLYPEWNEKYEFWGYTTPLREITCLATVPPAFPVDDNGEVYDPFIHPDADEWAVDFIKAVIPLSVPQEAVEAYKNADVWKGFYQIDGKDFTGIAAVQTETNSGIHYDISGRIVAPDMPGIHIIRNADGSTRKILVR